MKWSKEEKSETSVAVALLECAGCCVCYVMLTYYVYWPQLQLLDKASAGTKIKKNKKSVFHSFVLSPLDLQKQVQGRVLSLPSPQVSLYCWLALVHRARVHQGQSAGIYAHAFSKDQVTIAKCSTSAKSCVLCHYEKKMLMLCNAI